METDEYYTDDELRLVFQHIIEKLRPTEQCREVAIAETCMELSDDNGYRYSSQYHWDCNMWRPTADLSADLSADNNINQ